MCAMIEKFLGNRHKKITRLCLKVGFTECYRKESSLSSQTVVVRPPILERLRYRMHERAAREETFVYEMSPDAS
jgi:hypothetical protein